LFVLMLLTATWKAAALSSYRRKTRSSSAKTI